MDDVYPLEEVKRFCKHVGWDQFTFKNIQPEQWRDRSDATRIFFLHTADDDIPRETVLYVLSVIGIQESAFIDFVLGV